MRSTTLGCLAAIAFSRSTAYVWTPVVMKKHPAIAPLRAYPVSTPNVSHGDPPYVLVGLDRCPGNGLRYVVGRCLVDELLVAQHPAILVKVDKEGGRCLRGRPCRERTLRQQG